MAVLIMCMMVLMVNKEALAALAVKPMLMACSAAAVRKSQLTVSLQKLQADLVVMVVMVATVRFIVVV